MPATQTHYTLCCAADSEQPHQARVTGSLRRRPYAQDFVGMLPLKELTHPTAAPLNLVTHLPDTTRQPDLGPKSYIAYGRHADTRLPSWVRLV